MGKQVDKCAKGENVGMVRRDAAGVGGADGGGAAERRAAARPEPVPFCRRCLHDFECDTDGR